MMYLSGYRLCDIRLMVCAGACVISTEMATAQGISPAEILLFQTNHLQNIHEPVVLTYVFKKVSNNEPSFDDEVQVKLTKVNRDGSASTSIDFLSGSRRLEIPETENAWGNPVLLSFLERDIAEMKRLTGGATHYFRKRIRLALADAAQVRPVTFTYKGKPVEGQEVSIEPYPNDPLRERFERYQYKRYVFLISTQVPGGVFQLRTSSLRGAGDSTQQDRLRTEETLTLEAVNWAANSKR